MNLSFATRITAYFGGLFLVAIGTLLALWYLGLPQFGLIGAGNQRLAEATRLLEMAADNRLGWIAGNLGERRGDILIVAENKTMATQLESGDADVQRAIERVFERLQRAYPDHYQRLMIVDPKSKRVVAASSRNDLDRPFWDQALIERVARPGISETIEHLAVGPEGGATLAIIRQIYAPEEDGSPGGRLVGILVALLDPHQFAGPAAGDEMPISSKLGTTVLFDPAGKVLSSSAHARPQDEGFRPNAKLAEGFEGTLTEIRPDGGEMLVVYRHLQLSAAQGWRLVHYVSKEEALAALKGSINVLGLAGLVLTLLSLILISLAARRITQPLHLLSTAARTLGAGDMSVRAPTNPNDSREIVQMASAFNGMADQIARDRRNLEDQVLARTRELLDERNTAQRYLDIAGTMLMVLDKHGKIVMINKAGERLLGFPAADLLGVDWFSRFIAAKDREDVRRVFDRLMAGDDELMEHYETPICIASGETRMLAWHNVLLRDETGDIFGVLSSAEDITERKQSETRINALAYFDQLTELPNRVLLIDRLRQATAASSRSDNHGAVLFIDLDNFKTLNDTQGHQVGDLLLQAVAQRLKQCTRDGDIVARLGGDEFVVVLEQLSASEQKAALAAQAVAEKILSTLNQSYRLGDIVHRSTPSIGVTLFRGDQTTTDDLMKQADLAMYKAKEAGRNTCRFFDPHMESAVKERAALEADLRLALREGEMLLHYQAQVLADGRVTGAEVLVRWQHPRRGVVSPGEFIPLAEATGLILPLGQWVLETACTQLAAWALRPDMAHLTIAVNVSAHQFREPNFVEQVVAALRQSGANPNRLKLELTESALLDKVEEIIEKMYALKAKGVGFSLDDFGTGYSSLTYLKRLPLDQLKIDQSFVRDVLVDPNDAAIARTIVALAQSLGLGVIAEGVETEGQRDFLGSNGCHAYQGYFFSRPLALEAFEAFATRP